MKPTTNQSLTELANAAFAQAAQKVIKRALQTGTPVIVCINGVMKEVDPLQLQKIQMPRSSSGEQ